MLFCSVPVICRFWAGSTDCPGAGPQGMDEAIAHHRLVHEQTDPDYSILPGNDPHSALVEDVRQSYAEYQLQEKLVGKLLDPKRSR